ncbi:MAG: alpha/beta hydrolase [Glaciihabitans sp.]|jgi:pimeloyl-ACP methyl ester carboxylesterase|nr:alpha/beta hydrolase [Glaciihabitans sp.]
MPISQRDETMTDTRTLQRDGGRIAYDVQGAGPLVICAPGMGDIRQTFRYLVPALVAAGYRVATFDLRGHGESDTTFASFDDEAEASDIVALSEHLGGPATVVGNSMGAAAGVIAAARRPELVSALVLVGPFVREPKMNALLGALMKIATAPLWAAPVWKTYLPSLYAGRKPADQAEFAAQANAAMKRRGYATTFSKTTHTTHDPAEAVLGKVSAPTLVVMGELDPDFPKPADEAYWIAGQLNGTVLMVTESGHYPQSQRPDIVNPAVIEFLESVVRA